MYQYILGASLFKSVIPYMRKHILNTLDSHDLLYLDALIFFIIVLCIFIYKCVFDRTQVITTINNYQHLTIKHLLCIVAISLMSVAVVYFVLHLDKFYNTPLINYISRVSITIIGTIIVGTIFFNEKYNLQHIFGIILTFIGIYMMTTNDMG